MCCRSCLAGLVEFGLPKPLMKRIKHEEAVVVDKTWFGTPGAWPRKLADLQREHGVGHRDCRVVLASWTQQGVNKRENEDRSIQLQEMSKSVPFSIIGVLDGHDTSVASQTVKELLPPLIAKHLVDGYSVFDANAMALAEVESRLAKNKCTSGTCVLCCTISGRFIWCSNLGDCRAALVQLQMPTGEREFPRPERLCWMSHDHRASDPGEQRRIEKAGGEVRYGRIEGLEPSRTLGDFDVKSKVPNGTISIEPEVRRYELGDGKDVSQAVLVCGSDGVWDNVTGQDLCNMIHQSWGLGGLLFQLRNGQPADDIQPMQKLGEDLVRLSRRKGGRDDCTCAIALISLA
mmetsp:Transcript_124609/g.248656  ORF Transcript_124609/g.248656 Transcript_124609/m.248656 type:complete len:346 (+) Transcript_124609:70-1107(+)